MVAALRGEAVWTLDTAGRLAGFSNYDEQVDIMAPGSRIVSVDITNGDAWQGIGSCSGTSMSAPHVSAAAAMMLAVNPALSNDDIRDILMASANYETEGFVGEVDLQAAIHEAAQWKPHIKTKEDKMRRRLMKKKMAAIGDRMWE